MTSNSVTFIPAIGAGIKGEAAELIKRNQELRAALAAEMELVRKAFGLPKAPATNNNGN